MLASAVAEKTAADQLEAVQREAARLEKKQQQARDKIDTEAALELQEEKEAERVAVERLRAARLKETVEEESRRAADLERKQAASVPSRAVEQAPESSGQVDTTAASEFTKEFTHRLCTVHQSAAAPAPAPSPDSPDSTPLDILVTFNVAVASFSNLEVDIQNTTKTLRLGIQTAGAVEFVSVPLLARVRTDTMKAKFSKKKMTLTLKADMILI